MLCRLWSQYRSAPTAVRAWVYAGAGLVLGVGLPGLGVELVAFKSGKGWAPHATPCYFYPEGEDCVHACWSCQKLWWGLVVAGVQQGRSCWTWLGVCAQSWLTPSPHAPVPALQGFKQQTMWCGGGGRDVTAQREPYPSFCPEDLPGAQAAARAAVAAADAAAARAPDSQVLQHGLAPTPRQLRRILRFGRHGRRRQDAFLPE